MGLEVYREIWRITERKGGATYKTKYVEEGWYPYEEAQFGRPHGDPDLIWVSSNKEIISIRRKA